MKKIRKKIKKILSSKYRSVKIYWSLFRHVSFSKCHEKQIIICFNGAVPHGGLIDRIKGIISFYEISKLLKLNFYIYFNHPFHLSDFLTCNQVNWKLDKSGFSYYLRNSQVLNYADRFDLNPYEVIKKSRKKQFLVFCNVDFLETIYQDKTKDFFESKWRTNYNELFQMSELLSNTIASLPQEKRLVIHTRFTSLLGDFKDSTRVVLKQKEQHDLMERNASKINEIVEVNDHAVYVLSDSIRFLDFIKSQARCKVLNGSPSHIDHGENNWMAHLKVFADFYFIGLSDEIVLLRMDRMYNSNFSRYAAILFHKPFHIVNDGC